MQKAMLIMAMMLPGVFIAEAEAAIAFRAASSAGVRQPTINIRGTGAVATAASGNITPGLAQVELNAFLFCLVEQHDNVVISFPAGWRQLYSISTTTTHRASAFYKAAAATEANPLITHPGGNSIIAQCKTFRGVDAANPLDVAFAAQYAASSTSVTSGSLTTLSANDLMLYAMHVSNSPSVTVAPTGAGGVTWTQQFYNSTTLGLDSAIGLYTGPKAAAGAVGPITATISAASENHGVLMALRDATRLSITVPTGTIAGDVMIAAIATTPSTVPITAPAGWTLIQAPTQTSATSNRVSTYYRVATASEPVSYSWTLSTAHTGAAGGIVSYSGVDNTAPIDVSQSAVTASALTHSAPSITTTMANDMLVTVHEFASSNSWTPPAGMTERVDIASRAANAAGVTLEMNELLLGAAGATGTKIATAAANADAGATVSIALKAVVAAPHRIRIEHFGGACVGSTAPAQITLKACANVACTAPHFILSNVTGITLAPTTAGYTLTPANPQTILAASGGVNSSVTLARSAAGTATLAITGTPSPAPSNAYECYNANTNTSGDCNLVFTADAFIYDVPNHTADSRQLVTLTSCKGTFANTSRSIKFWSTYVNPATGGQQGKLVTGTGNANCATGYSALSTSSASPTTLSLAFGSGTTPQATFSLCYPDAGQVQVDTRYDGSVATGDSGTVILGNDRFIAVPYRFLLSNITCGNGSTYVGCHVTSPYANPGAANASGSAFMKAGNPFSMTVTAYNTNGAVTPNFGKETLKEGVTLTSSLIADTDLTFAGSLTGTFGNFSNGVATGTAFSFDEVGIITLSAKLTSASYLGSGIKEITNPATGNIGRFTPNHFTVNPHALNPILPRSDLLQTTAAATGTVAPSTLINVDITTGFNVGSKVRIPGAGAGGNAFTATVTVVNAAGLTLTLDTAIGTTLIGGEAVLEEWGSYMGEKMQAQFDLSATNSNGNVTQNYQGAYAKLNPATAGNPLRLGAMDAAGPTYNLALDTSLTASGSFSGGSATIVAPLSVTRGASPNGPFNSVKIGIAPTAETDGIRMGVLNLGVSSATSDRTSVMDNVVQATTAVRYGRIKLGSAHGSELLPLPIPVTAQYWSGANYVTHANDSLTTFANTNVVFSNCQKNLSTGAAPPNNCKPVVVVATPPASVVFVSGVSSLKLNAPGTGNNGSADLTINGLSYLPSNTARATFGIYKNPKEFIYMREMY